MDNRYQKTIRCLHKRKTHTGPPLIPRSVTLLNNRSGPLKFAIVVFLILFPTRNPITVSVGPLTTFQLFGLVLFVIWVYDIVNHTRPIRKPHLFHLAMFSIVSLSFISLLWTDSVAATLSKSMRYMFIAGITYIIWDLFRTQRDAEKGLLLLLVGIGMISILYNSHILLLDGGRAGQQVGGLLQINANRVARITSLSLPIVYYFLVYGRTRMRYGPLFYFLILSTSILTILLAGSRQAFIAVVIVGIVFLIDLVSKKRHLPIYRHVAIIILIAVIIFLAAIISIPRFERVLDFQNYPTEILTGEFGGRGEIWEQGFSHFPNSPVFGTGSGSFVHQAGVESTPHNMYLDILFELGVMGMTIFVIGITSIVKDATSNLEIRPVFLSLLLMILVLGLVAELNTRAIHWVVLTLFISLPYQIE